MSMRPSATASMIGALGIGPRIVAVHCKSPYVLDNLACGQRLRRRRIVVVVTAHLNADRQSLQQRCIEGVDAQMTILAGYERIRGTVVAPGSLQLSILRRDPDDDVATLGVERIAHEAAALRQPVVLEWTSQLARHERRDPVLEAVTMCVRERHVVRIGADAQRRLRHRCRSEERPHRQRKRR